MRQKIYIVIASFSFVLFSAIPLATGQKLSLHIESGSIAVGNITLEESITARELLQIESETGSTIDFELDYFSTGVLRSQGSNKSYLVCLTPGKQVQLTIQADSSLLTNSVADSLLNYLWKSNNNFIVEHGSTIFNPQQISDVLDLFEDFRKDRAAQIQSHAHQLTKEELDLLQYQNEARINSFLFYFGRMVQNLPASDPFFDFVERIDPENPWAKTLPQNVLYQFEVNYLRQQDTLQSISTFIKYIHTSTRSKDQAEFFQAIYLRELMESPSYWTKHIQLFNSDVLEEELKSQSPNRYYTLLERSSTNYFHAQAGEVAFDFKAIDQDGLEVQLSDFKGKFVFIDNWASWCGPCLRHRPVVLELSRKMAEESKLVFLMVSVDATEKAWKRHFARKVEKAAPALDLLVENGMATSYGDHYNIRFIPKYVLIGPDGKIIDANLPEPGPGLERFLKQHLTR